MRIAVVGTGMMGRNHARVVGALGHDLVGVVDADPAAAEDAAKQNRSKPFADLKALLDAEEPEAVIIATPTTTHAPLAMEALDAGLHVLVEKPVAHSLDAAAQMVAKADEVDRTLAVGHIERHNPVVSFLRAGIGEAFGQTISLEAERVSPMPGRIRDVGCILDIGIHDLDIFNHLAGRTPRSVYALGGSHTPGLEFEDHASILVDYGDGLHGRINVSWLTPQKSRTLTVTGEKAHATADYIAQTISVITRPEQVGPGLDADTRTEHTDLTWQEPLRRELADFVEAIEKDLPPLVDGRAGLHALAAAEAAVRSLKTGEPERLTVNEAVA